MGAFVMAWLVGETIVIYRSVKQVKGPPGPGQLLLSSGVFAILALLAESEKARRPAILLAWGFDIAAFMNLFGTGAPKKSNTVWKPAPAPNTVVFPSGGLYLPLQQNSLPPGASTPTTGSQGPVNA